jgi:hypothetical protein
MWTRRVLFFLAVILHDYCVICPPANPQCATARLRLTGGLSLVSEKSSALKRGRIRDIKNDSGVGRGKSLAMRAKLRAQKLVNSESRFFALLRMTFFIL